MGGTWKGLKKDWKEKPFFKWGITIFLITLVMLYLFNHCLINLIADNVPSSSKSPQGDSAVAEFEAWLYFLSGAGTVILAYVAIQQLPFISKQSETQSHIAIAQFLLHIDERWCSEEMTEVRSELWRKYREERNKQNKKEKAIEMVGKYVVSVEEKCKKKPNKKNMKHFFRHLNFIELLGTIYFFKKRKLIEKEEDFFRELFGGELHMYLKFYESYLKERSRKDNIDSNAYKLLKEFPK